MTGNDKGRFDIKHELSPAKAAARYQIDRVFRGLQLRLVDRNAAPNANMQLGSIDASAATWNEAKLREVIRMANNAEKSYLILNGGLLDLETALPATERSRYRLYPRWSCLLRAVITISRPALPRDDVAGLKEPNGRPKAVFTCERTTIRLLAISMWICENAGKTCTEFSW